MRGLGVAVRARVDGTGRTHAITVRCTDDSGNQTLRTVAVNVPHSQ